MNIKHNRAKILLVEDDLELSELLAQFLSEYYIVKAVSTPLEALELVKIYNFNVIILDLSLPQMDGLELCTKLKDISSAKIIISSARDAIDDKLSSFELGAEDYLPKPYDPRELHARVEILLKNSNLRDDSLYIDEDKLKVYYKDEFIELSTAEFEIFYQLYTHEAQIISREQLSYSMNAHSLDSSLDSINVLVGRIRKKLKKLSEKEIIKTIRLSGYKYEAI